MGLSLQAQTGGKGLDPSVDASVADLSHLGSLSELEFCLNPKRSEYSKH